MLVEVIRSSFKQSQVTVEEFTADPALRSLWRLQQTKVRIVHYPSAVMFHCYVVRVIKVV